MSSRRNRIIKLTKNPLFKALAIATSTLLTVGVFALIIFNGALGTVQAEAIRLGLPFEGRVFGFDDSGRYIEGYARNRYDADERVRVNVSFYSECNGQRTLVSSRRTRASRDIDGYENQGFRARIPRNIRYDCKVYVEVCAKERGFGYEFWVDSYWFFPNQLNYDRSISISGRVQSVSYEGEHATITGYAQNNFDPQSRVRIRFYQTNDIYNSRRLGSDNTDREQIFEERIRLSKLEADHVYVFAYVDGWYYQLPGSPIYVNRNFQSMEDPEPAHRQRSTHQSRSRTTVPQSTRNSRSSSSRRRSTQVTSDVERRINTLENRYNGNYVLVPYTDARETTISLRYDATLAQLLQDHARQNDMGFGSEEHMDKLRSQGILKKRPNNWYVYLPKLEEVLS
jgi:hypothetical protein